MIITNIIILVFVFKHILCGSCGRSNDPMEVLMNDPHIHPVGGSNAAVSWCCPQIKRRRVMTSNSCDRRRK